MKVNCVPYAVQNDKICFEALMGTLKHKKNYISGRHYTSMCVLKLNF